MVNEEPCLEAEDDNALIENHSSVKVRVRHHGSKVLIESPIIMEVLKSTKGI